MIASVVSCRNLKPIPVTTIYVFMQEIIDIEGAASDFRQRPFQIFRNQHNVCPKQAGTVLPGVTRAPNTKIDTTT